MVPWTSKGEDGVSQNTKRRNPPQVLQGKLGILSFENLLTDGFFRMGLTKPLGLPGLACGFFVSGKTAFNRQLFRAETCETFIHTNGQMCFFDQTKIGRRTPAMFFFFRESQPVVVVRMPM